MDTGTATIVIALMSTGAIVALFVAMRRRPTALAVSWGYGGYFLFSLASVSSLGLALGALPGQRRVVGYVIGQTTRYFGITQIVVAGTGVITLFFCLFALRLWARHSVRFGLAGLVAVALSILGVMVNGINGVESSANLYVTMIATVATLFAASVIRPGKDVVLGPAVYGIVLGVISAIVAIINPGDAFLSCRADKCGPAGLLFAGALGNENALGLALALSFPFVLLAFKGPTKWVLGSYIFAMVYLTGSRTALLAAGVALAIALACNPHIQGEKAKGRFGLVAVIAGVAAVVTGLVLPFTTTDRGAFSGRGIVWEIAKRYIYDAPLFGSGAGAWVSLTVRGEVSAVSAYSAHNIWLDALFTAGVVGLLATVVLVVALLSTSPPWLIALPIITVLTAGIFERPWTLTATNWLVWVLPALLLLRRAGVLPEPAGLRSVQTGSRDLSLGNHQSSTGGAAATEGLNAAHTGASSPR